MAEEIESMTGTYLSAGIGVSVLLLAMIIAVSLFVKRTRANAAKRNNEGLKIIHSASATWYDPCFLKEVPEQVGKGDSYIEEGLLAVFTPDKRTKSAECLLLGRNDPLPLSSLGRFRLLSDSTHSLCSLPDERCLADNDSPVQSQILKSSPYIDFNFHWASKKSSLSVSVLSLTDLQQCFFNATCSYKVTLHKPDKSTLSRTSSKVKNVTHDPDCVQLFSFPASLEEAQQSKLVIEVHARKSKHLLSMVIGELEYHLPRNLSPDTLISTSQPLIDMKKDPPSTYEGRRKSVYGPIGSHWGELKVLIQYQPTGRSQGRVKVMIIKGHSALLNKDTGSYKVEMTVKEGSKTITVHHTKRVHGPKPVWKEPFIFDVTQDKVRDYRVELSLIRISRIKKTTSIGLVELGLNTSATGTQHWQDMIAEPNKELTMWHSVNYAEWM